jgi:hypothetical protein
MQRSSDIAIPVSDPYVPQEQEIARLNLLDPGFNGVDIPETDLENATAV